MMAVHRETEDYYVCFAATKLCLSASFDTSKAHVQTFHIHTIQSY